MRFAFCLSFVATLVMGAPSATTYLVLPDGMGDFPTIQAAVDAAQTGDVIELGAGTFLGPGNRDVDSGGKDLVVCSESDDPLTCRIDCEGTWVEPHRGFFFHRNETQAARVQGLQIMNGYAADYGGGIAIEYGSSPTIANCIISDCFAGYAGAGISCRETCAPLVQDCVLAFNESSGDIVAHGGGMYCGHSSNASVEGCTFWGNRASLRGGGFHCHANSTAILSRCTFYANEALNGANIDVRNYSWALIEYSIIDGGRIGEGVTCESGCDAFLHCCDVFGNCGGDWVGCLEGQLGAYGNICANPLFCAPDHGNFHLEEDSPCGPSAPHCALIGAWTEGCGVARVPELGLATGLDFDGAEPNPFGARIRFSYHVPVGEGEIRLEIRDVAGALVRSLVRSHSAPGSRDAVWDGRDGAGRQVAAGVYFSVLKGSSGTASRRVLLIR